MYVFDQLGRPTGKPLCLVPTFLRFRLLDNLANRERSFVETGTIHNKNLVLVKAFREGIGIYEMSQSCLKIIVRGRVQGVFYRANAAEKANEFGLVGTVRNTEDGAVEIVAQGGTEALTHFVHWCRQGPPRAKVEKVETAPHPVSQERQGFQIIG